MKEQDLSEFTEKHIQQCIAAGCDSAYLNKDGWLCGELPREKGEIIIRMRAGAINAWVVVHRSPKAITREVKDGFAPQSAFCSIGEACKLAIQNPYY